MIATPRPMNPPTTPSCVGFLIAIWVFRKFSLDADVPFASLPLAEIPASSTP